MLVHLQMLLRAVPLLQLPLSFFLLCTAVCKQKLKSVIFKITTRKKPVIILFKEVPNLKRGGLGILSPPNGMVAMIPNHVYT